MSTVTGRVTGANGAAKASLSFTLRYIKPTAPGNAVTNRTITTNGTGNFSFSASPGEYRLDFANGDRVSIVVPLADSTYPIETIIKST